MPKGSLILSGQKKKCVLWPLFLTSTTATDFDLVLQKRSGKIWDGTGHSARIIADIEDFGVVLDLIIEFKGCVVPECRLRHGHWQQTHYGGRVLKRKVINRQRKHLLTMGPVHPDAPCASSILLSIDEVVELAFDEIKETLIIEENNLNQITDSYTEEEDEIPEECDIHEANF